MNELSKWSSANKVKRSVEKIALDAIDRNRPATKTASVKEINLIDKYCMVVYLGEPEDNIVKIPFNNVVPSYVGQFVRIGGTASDRSIVEVMGDTATDANVTDMKARLAALEAKPVAGAYSFENTMTQSGYRTDNTPRRAPLSVENITPAGWVTEGTLGLRCTQAGLYYIGVDWTFPGTGFTGGDDCQVEIEIRTPAGDVHRRKTSYRLGEGTLSAGGMFNVGEGWYACVNVWSGKWRDHGNVGAQWIRFYGMYQSIGRW